MGNELKHVAIIMDGNGRWAEARGLPRLAGHRQGVQAVERTVRAAREMGIGYLTLFGFSDENWRRPPTEVQWLMTLMEHFATTQTAALADAGVRLRVIGELTRLPERTRGALAAAVHATRHGRAMTLTLAVSYGGRGEILRACRRIARQVAEGALAPSAVDGAAFEAGLDTHGLPDPDLVIRTAGEQRLSNFLLWQSAYAELFFTHVPWPDFQPAHLRQAVECFGRRARTFGTLAAGGGPAQACATF